MHPVEGAEEPQAGQKAYAKATGRLAGDLREADYPL